MCQSLAEPYPTLSRPDVRPDAIVLGAPSICVMNSCEHVYLGKQIANEWPVSDDGLDACRNLGAAVSARLGKDGSLRCISSQ
jgi:hypothetical protein